MTQRAVALMVGEHNNLAVAQERQAFIRAYAEMRDIEIASFLVLERKDMKEGFLHAVNLCTSHRARMIIIDAFENMFMPVRDLIQMLTSLIEYDITLSSAYDNVVMDFDELLAFSIMLKASLACEHETKSNQIKKSLKAVQKKGKRLGGIAFGAKPSEGVIIRQIMKLYEDGFSLQKICNLLESNNIKTVAKKTWHPTTVKRIIDRHK